MMLLQIVPLLLLQMVPSNSAQGEAHLTGPQIAQHYEANFLSLTDAAQIISLMAEIMNNKDIHENAKELKKLDRMAFWTCAEFVTPSKGILGIGKEERAPWQSEYSRRLCQNMYRLLAMVDIELMMFYIKLDKEVNSEHMFGFLHWDEKHVADVDLHNFKLSRMFAFARILTVRLLKLASNTEAIRRDPFAGQFIDTAHYMNLLRQFDKRTEELLELLSNSTKFKMAQHESFWSWLKNKKEKVVKALDEKVKKKGWFEKDNELLVRIYQQMELGVKEKPTIEGMYEEQKPWYKRMFEGNAEEAKEQSRSGMYELFEQTPWFFPRIHKMVNIFAQLHEVKEGAKKEKVVADEMAMRKHARKISHRSKVNSKEAEERAEERENREHPEYWKLTELHDRQKQKHFEKAKMNQYNILQLLKLFETDEFDELKKNTGKDAFTNFFVNQLEEMVNLSVDEGVMTAVKEIILKKVEETEAWMNLEMIRDSLEIPVELGAELLSYREQNVFTLATFYKFAVHLAEEYAKIKNGGKSPKDSLGEEFIHEKINNFFKGLKIGDEEENVPPSPHLSPSKSMRKSPSLKKGEEKNVNGNKNEEKEQQPDQHRHPHMEKFREMITNKHETETYNPKLMAAKKSIGIDVESAKVEAIKPRTYVTFFELKLQKLMEEIEEEGELRKLKGAIRRKKANGRESDLLEAINFNDHFEIVQLEHKMVV